MMTATRRSSRLSPTVPVWSRSAIVPSCSPSAPSEAAFARRAVAVALEVARDQLEPGIEAVEVRRHPPERTGHPGEWLAAEDLDLVHLRLGGAEVRPDLGDRVRGLADDGRRPFERDREGGRGRRSIGQDGRRPVEGLDDGVDLLLHPSARRGQSSAGVDEGDRRDERQDQADDPVDDEAGGEPAQAGTQGSRGRPGRHRQVLRAASG